MAVVTTTVSLLHKYRPIVYADFNRHLGYLKLTLLSIFTL
jgi:hypothetical protein